MLRCRMLRIGILLALAVPIGVGLFSAACTCGPDGPTNPDECNFRGDPGTETRALELGSVPEPSDGMPTPDFVPFTDGVVVPKTRGFQGSDMLVTEMRLPAQMDDPSDNRCVRVRYDRSGDEGSANYTVDLELVRQGDWWVARRAVFDPTVDTGMMMLNVTLEDSMFTATGTVSIELVDPI